ncbi:hypothetical protein [Salinicola sp. DM10]|uniref:hypothetical protein n=1 Tax=Salinicola sp. DM10 TaxID=2815721 RepID=UPI001A8C09D4|nr:hypothetical protein [Salinicola sp. DM10]MCE3025744.1 hypothetical protein [Salinicola sp. DM10]
MKMVKSAFDRAKHRVILGLTPDRCGLAAATIVILGIFGLFSGLSGSGTTHGLNMMGGGLGMAVGLLVLMGLPLVAGLWVRKAVKRKRDACYRERQKAQPNNSMIDSRYK